jgi:hypothetical protein
MLGRSESSIRRLLLVLDAPAADFQAARQQKISTNQLLRSATAHRQQQAARRQANAQRELERQAADAARIISNWFKQTRLNGRSCETILNEVRREFAIRQADGALPAPSIPNLHIDEIIRRSRPADDHDIDITAWFAHWLCRWTFFAFPDPHIRDHALDLALKLQERR